MPYIRGVDGVTRTYAEYTDKTVFQLKEQMRREYYTCASCGHKLSDKEAQTCMGLCAACRRDSLIKHNGEEQV